MHSTSNFRQLSRALRGTTFRNMLRVSIRLTKILKFIFKSIVHMQMSNIRHWSQLHPLQCCRRTCCKDIVTSHSSIVHAVPAEFILGGCVRIIPSALWTYSKEYRFIYSFIKFLNTRNRQKMHSSNLLYSSSSSSMA